MAKVELEAKLAIVSERAATIADAISRLSEVGAYKLLPRPEVTVRDIYLDTEDGRLLDRRLNLRIRLVASDAFITVKGRDKSTARGMEREEYEAPWSGAALEQGLSMLNGLGVALPDPPPEFGNDPLAVMARMGFRPIQERETCRRARAVVRAGLNTPVAELAVDAVEFCLSGGSVRHYEVEVELEEAGEATVIGEVVAELTSRWPELRPWPYSKVATGSAVEALLRQGRLPLSSLAPEAYGLIATQLGPPLV